MKAIKQDNPSFHLPDRFQIPVSLIEVIRRAFNRRYADFYLDRRPKEGHDAEEAIHEVLQAFVKSDHIKSHRRLQAMGYTMALAARATFVYHEISDGRLNLVLNHVKCWLEACSEKDGNAPPRPNKQRLFFC